MADADTISTQDCDFSFANNDPVTQQLVAAFKAHGAVFEATYFHRGPGSIRRLRPEPFGFIPPWYPYDPVDAQGQGTKNQLYLANQCTDETVPVGDGTFESFTRCQFRNPYVAGDVVGDYQMLIHEANVVTPVRPTLPSCKQ